MKLMLINSNRFRQPWPVIPFGLCCVASAAEAAGHEVFVLDLCFSRHPEKEIAQAVHDFSPEVIGVNIRNIDNGVGYNALFLLSDILKKIITPCKKSFSGPIIIGGPAVGISAPEILDYFDLEFAICGDGEDAIVEFLNRIDKKSSLEAMPGLVWRKGGRIVEKNEPMRVENLNALHRKPPTRYLDISKYRRYNSPIQIQTKRGCALSCSYCTYNRIEGGRYRLRDAKLVADEIERLVRETGIRHIEFTDSTFNIPLDHAKAVLREIINKDISLQLRTMGLNPGAVDEELVALMKSAGFQDVDLGAEAGCDAMLKSLGKNFNKQDILRAGQLLRNKKIPVTWYLLLGAVGETVDTVNETFDTIVKAASPWDLVNIAVGMRVYEGSPIADWLREKYPASAHDNFFKPATLPADVTLGLNELKYIIKCEAFQRDNFFMYDEDEKTPPFILAVGSALLKIFAPSQPIWRLFIIQRKIQKLLGIRWFQKRLYLRRYQ